MILKKIMCLSIVLLLISMFAIPCSAVNAGFSVSDISEDNIVTIFERFHIQSISEPDTKRRFSCFSVNDAGEYALGFDVGEEDIILVYDSDGSYLYGFSASSNGSFGIKLGNDSLTIYHVRSDLAVTIDKNGNCLDMKKIQNTSANNDYWNQVVFANRKCVNDTTFIAEHWLYNSESLRWGSYPRLVKELPGGERMVLFDAGSEWLVNFLLVAVIVVLPLLGMLAVIIVYQVKHSSVNRP